MLRQPVSSERVNSSAWTKMLTCACMFELKIADTNQQPPVEGLIDIFCMEHNYIYIYMNVYALIDIICMEQVE